MPLAELNRVAGALIARHAARLGKWKMTNTVKLMGELVDYFESGGAQSHKEFVALAEAIMLAIDRINTWIDGMLPWSQLDRRVKLNPAPR
jgi:hypothetical protein